VTRVGPDALTAAELSAEHIQGLEFGAARAWPAAEQVPFGGWVLRTSPATPRRVNSVFTHAAPPSGQLDAHIDAVEAFYRERDRPPRFQVTRASLPMGLVERLAERGYGIEAPVDIQLAAPDDISAVALADTDVELPERPTGDWRDVYVSGFGRDVSDVLDLIKVPTVFPVLRRGGQALAVGIGVLVAGWVCVFGMQTRESHRGQGLGTAVMAAMVGWGVAEGAHGFYLQVEDDNPGAKRLYERMGFRTRYGYHYRSLLET